MTREEVIARLAAVDSPTVANAVERFKVRPQTVGYADGGLRCQFPEMVRPMVGFAVTCTADSVTEGRPAGAGLMGLWEAIAAAPKPAVVVIKDVGGLPLRGCHMGEVMATISKGLGAVGCVSDGGLRDVMEVRALGDFHYFCPHLVVSHGWPVILEVNVPVQIHGLDIRPGDLLHGDGNGLLGIPADVVDALPAACQSVRDDEAEILRLARQPGFSLDDLRQWQSVKH